MGIGRYRYIWVVTAAAQQAARDFAQVIDPSGGAECFSSALSSDGQAPATHYWACWAMTNEEYERLSELSADFILDGRMMSFSSAQETASQVLSQLGLQPVAPND